MEGSGTETGWKAIPMGTLTLVEMDERNVPVGLNLLIVLLPAFAAKRLPAESKSPLEPQHPKTRSYFLSVPQWMDLAIVMC